MALRIGMHTGVQDVSYPDLRKLWQIADSNGFYWVSVWDHFYENPTQDGKSPCFEATTTMAAIAAETENVRIGCLVMAVGYRNPGPPRQGHRHHRPHQQRTRRNGHRWRLVRDGVPRLRLSRSPQ